MYPWKKKLKKNPNIRKLYGALHIYLWGNEFIVKENVQNWDKLVEHFLEEISSSKLTVSKHILDLICDSESGKELAQILKELKDPVYVSNYLKNIFIRAFNESMTSRNYYAKALLDEAELDIKAKTFITKGVEQLAQMELYHLNKSLFYSSYKTYLDPISEWRNGTSHYVLDDVNPTCIKKIST